MWQKYCIGRVCSYMALHKISDRHARLRRAFQTASSAVPRVGEVASVDLQSSTHSTNGVHVTTVGIVRSGTSARHLRSATLDLTILHLLAIPNHHEYKQCTRPKHAAVSCSKQCF